MADNTIQHLQDCLHKKNVALDAMQWVWCDGGCAGGTNRYLPNELTEDMVITAERNVKRMRSWYENSKFKNEWKSMSTKERESWLKKAMKDGAIGG